MGALDDDQTAVAFRNFVQRQSDLVSEFLAHDQQTSGTLAEQLLAAALRQHVGVKEPLHAYPRVVDHIDQSGIGLSGADRKHVGRQQQRAQLASILLRDADAEAERGAAVWTRIDRGEHALKWAIANLDENADAEGET